MVRRDPVGVLDDSLVTRVGQNKMKTGETHSRQCSVNGMQMKWKNWDYIALIIWVNQELGNKCISKSDVSYIANLPIYFDILLGGDWKVSNETLESVYMSSRQCKLYLCFPVMQTAHVPVGSFSCIK